MIRRMELVVQPLQRTLAFAPGANLLAVLREAQLPISYSCLAGRCGTCRCTLTDGERRTVLACQTTLSAPCTVEIPEPDEVVVHTARIVKATVTALDDLAPGIKRLRLAPAKSIDFSPGQYLQLQFAAGLARPYSAAGLCSDGELEFHIRLVRGGRVTGHIAEHLKPGDAVRVSGPLGAAYLRQRHTGPMLCVAGGTGLAPVLSILRGAIAEGMGNPIRVYVGARSAREAYGAEALQALARQHPDLRTRLVTGMEGDAPGRHHGRLTEAIAAELGPLDGWRAYLCGSPALVEATAELARHKGLAPERIHADAFYPQNT